MIEALSLFEAHLDVADVHTAVAFYQRVVGLRLAHLTQAGDAAFLWIGGAGQAMLGLWAAGPGPQRITSHVAFRVDLPVLEAAPRMLRAAGVTPLDFDGRTTDQPVVLAWMPAAAVYFRDPDGHLLEFVAMLPDPPRPEAGVVGWRTWARMHRQAGSA